MKTTLGVLIGTLMLFSTACIFEVPSNWFHDEHVTWDGLQVKEHDGVITVDGIELNHVRWVTVTGSLDDQSTASLALRTATGTIDVESSGDASYALEVQLHSEVEDDGEVLMESGRLVTRSVGDSMLFINEIRGTAPEGVSLRVESGMGTARIRGFRSGQEIRLDVGGGDASAELCTVTTMFISSGMGSVGIYSVQGRELELDAGMGNVTIEDSTFDRVDGDLGMGNATIRDSIIGDLEIDLGMGNLRLVDSTVTRLEGDVGMGNLILDGSTPRPEAMDVEMGMGSIVLR